MFVGQAFVRGGPWSVTGAEDLPQISEHFTEWQVTLPAPFLGQEKPLHSSSRRELLFPAINRTKVKAVGVGMCYMVLPQPLASSPGLGHMIRAKQPTSFDR